VGGIVGQAEQYGLPEKEAFVLPSADEFSFYAGITPGTMRRAGWEDDLQDPHHKAAPPEWPHPGPTPEHMRGPKSIDTELVEQQFNDPRFK
jgi:hypothetical protein